MLKKEWFTAAELAAESLPGLPASKRGMAKKASRDGWTAEGNEGRLWRRNDLAIEFHYTALPARAVTKLAKQYLMSQPAEANAAPVYIDRFVRASDKQKIKAEARVHALRELEILSASLGRTEAVKQVAAAFSVSVATLYNWQGLAAGTQASDRAAALTANYKGRTKTASFSDGAWQFLLDLYLQKNRWTLEKCLAELRDKARTERWVMPCGASIRRRIEREIPQPVLVLARQGEKALERLYPAQRRDRGHFHALECVNADGHKWDVFVRWPDGYIGRPMMVAFQDLYSNMVLSWRVDVSENKEAVRLTFGDLVGRYGIPKNCWLDNGRAFASKWLTGGIKNRFRFTYRDEEMHGILPLLGVNVHWTQPYSGQSKPIERAFGDFARDISRHPAFGAAWCGNKPDAKPEDFDAKKAVPLAEFLRIVGEEIEKWNDRPGRRTEVCAGKLSYRQAFSASYENSVITKASEMHRQLWLLAAEGVRVKRDASIELMGGQGRAGNRYHSHLLEPHAGQQVIVRFDPQWLERDIGVYALDGAFICMAPLLGNVAFDNAEAAGAHARAYRTWLKAQKAAAEALTRVNQAEVAAMLAPPPVPAPAPETRVVRPVFGNTALKPRPAEDAEASEAFFDNWADSVDREREEFERRHPHLTLITQNGADD